LGRAPGQALGSGLARVQPIVLPIKCPGFGLAQAREQGRTGDRVRAAAMVTVRTEQVFTVGPAASIRRIAGAHRSANTPPFAHSLAIPSDRFLPVAKRCANPMSPSESAPVKVGDQLNKERRARKRIGAFL